MSKWDMVRLGDVCRVVSGTTPKSADSKYWGGNINWITPAELNENTKVIYESVRKITELAVLDTGLKPFPAGTVILSSRAPIGKVAIAGKEMYCNQGFKNLICAENIYSEYLYFFLKAKTEHLNALGRGATFKEISKSIVENVEIPLPPFAEQQKIANELDKISGLIAKRKNQIEKLDLLVKAKFVEMFGDPVTNPMGWEIVKLSQLATKITDGVHAKPEYTATGKPFISVVNITSGKVNFKNCKFVSEEAYQKMTKSTHPQEGDILYTKVGATYGIPALVETEKEFCLYVSVCLIKVRHDAINNVFLFRSLEQPYVKHQADDRIKGIGVPDLHLNQIREFNIILPPLPLQTQFADFVQKIEQTKTTMQKSLAALETLYKARMQEYFES